MPSRRSCNRRTFLKLSSIGLVAGALPYPSGLLHAMGGGRKLEGEFTPLRRNVGIFTERGGTIGWLLSDDGVIVVDSQFADTAENFLGGLRDRTPQMIDVLINTHHHRDHTAGNGVLTPATRSIVAHARVPELQQVYEADDPQTYADTTFDDEWSTAIGDETVRAKHYVPAHTGADATIFFQEANVVHMGDLLFNRLYPFIDGPAGASVRGWIETLESIMGEHDSETLYIFGHGSERFGVTGSREDLGVQRDFLSAALETAEAGVRAGASIDDVADRSSLEGFPDHEGPPERLGLTLRVAYEEVNDGE